VNLLDRLVIDKAVHQDPMNELLVINNGHQDLLRALRGESVTPEQSMRNHRYQEFIGSQPQFFNGQLMHGGMECGSTLCMIFVTVNDEKAWTSFHDTVLGAGDYPTPVFMTFRTYGMPEYHVVFSVDPRVNSIMGSGECYGPSC
jgi:hypothetical protein